MSSRRYAAILRWFRLLALIIAGLCPAAAQDSNIDHAREAELFAQVDEMLTAISEIMGLEPREPIVRELITREAIRELVEKRLAEETTEEEIRLEELFLKRFGLVDEDFDLADQTIDVLTEQATALYDFKTKTLYLATWTPLDMQEFALVHELVHALQDQHFNLRKYVDGAKTSDGDLARMAVVEGQASWVMTEYVMQQGGRSLANNRFLAVAAAAASRVEAQDFPVFASSPLFLRETLLFPYTWGLLFQQSVIEEQGAEAFAEVFQRPPVSSQQILNPEAYLARKKPGKIRLSKPKLGRRFKKVIEGDVGQFEHSILIKKYADEETAKRLAPKWRAGHYVLFEPKSKERAVLSYAVEWETPEDAARYFEIYQGVLRTKRPSTRFDQESSLAASGRNEDGRFAISLAGTRVTSIEGLPDDKLE